MPDLLPIVQTGDLRKSLEALRDDLAQAMDEANPAIKAQLAGRLQAVLTQLADMPTTQGSTLDDLAKRRADRVSDAKPEVAATGKGRKRG